MLSRLTTWFIVGIAALSPVSGSAQPRSADSDLRLGLMIANSKYPDAEAALASPPTDARALAEELRRSGYDIDVKEDLTKEQMQRSLEAFYSKIKSGSTALLFFSGYGIQTGRQSYLIPVNAQIWTEAEVKRDGFSLDAILAEMNARGANVKIAILDASRRNPFERRFNRPSSGLATVNLPKGTIVFYSAVPGYVVPDSDAKNSLFITELLKEMRSPGLAVEDMFNRTRIGVTRASKGEQVPWISSLVVDDVYFGPSPKPSSSVAADKTDDDAAVRRDFEAAERTNTKKSYEDFLQKHKFGPYAKLARDNLAKLDTPSRDSQTTASKTPESRRETRQEATRTETKQDAKTASRTETAASRTEPTDKSRASAHETSSKAASDPVVRELNDTLRLNPQDADAFYKRGQAHARLGEYKVAARDFDEAIRLNQSDAEAYNNRCFVRAVVGELDSAIADCKEALRLRPNYTEAMDSLGFAYLKKGQFSSAIENFNAVIKESPRQASALFGRGKARLQSGATKDGNADIAAAKKVQSDIADEFARYGLR